jgi:recombination protein RecA
MANTALAVLESALRARKLDRTLTTALSPLERTDAAALMPTDIATLDACLRPSAMAQGGGLPRGQLSEITGPASAGRTTLLLQLMAAAAQRGEIAALVDTLDRLDVASAAAARIDLTRLLWVRGDATLPIDRAVERALKSLNLVLQAGGFGVVAIDLADVPPIVLKRIPFNTWLRVQRAVEGSDTACVLVTPEPLARSAGGVTLTLRATPQWRGDADRARLLGGLAVTARLVSSRRRVTGEVRIVTTAADDHHAPTHRSSEHFNESRSSLASSPVACSVPPCLGVPSPV